MNKPPRLMRRAAPIMAKPAPAMSLPEVAPARLAAFEILQRVADEDAYASNLLASEQYDSLSREDHGLLNELVLGVLRWQRTLDLFIERYAQRPVNQLDRAVILALRLGLYQLRFLTRIPAHAALNESVNLVKLHDKHYAAPFVNGVLRAATRDAETTVETLLASVPNEIARDGFATSHPSWLLKRWQERLGVEAATQLTQTNNTQPRTALRLNELQAPAAQTHAWLTQHEIQTRASGLAPQALVIESGSLNGLAEPVRDGWLYIQDEASQLVTHLAALSTQAGRVLDMCAAPGSKALLLAALLPAVDIVANDLHAHRLRTLEELRARLGVMNLLTQQYDATLPLPKNWGQGFDLVLLDAPCSGLGTLQRHPEIKWRVTEAKLKELASLQSSLLASAARCLKPNGVLVYAVCSTEPEEGEAVVAALRTEDSAFVDITGERLTALGLNPEDFLTDTFGARTWPHLHGCEGFFFCVLKREPLTTDH